MDISDLFFEVHSGLPRETAGSAASTERAFRMVERLPPQPRILDVGCGPGEQTVHLAQMSGGYVAGLDNHQPFLDDLARKAEQAGVADRIIPMNASMFEMSFDDESFDLVWSEGAIFIIGFERGLGEWKRLIRPGGYIAVSECCWLTDNPPETVRVFWDAVYPAIATVERGLEVIAGCGYELIGHFVLPESDWWDSYYTPMTQRVSELRVKYASDPEALRHLDEEMAEIELYREYSDTYGYAFYVARKP